jgi:hypothetical protein
MMADREYSEGAKSFSQALSRNIQRDIAHEQARRKRKKKKKRLESALKTVPQGPVGFHPMDPRRPRSTEKPNIHEGFEF